MYLSTFPSMDAAEKGLDPESPREQFIPHEPAASTSCGIPLYRLRAAPSFLQTNPYITDGYRAHLTPKLCVKRLAGGYPGVGMFCREESSW